MSIITCSETQFQEESFYILTSNKKHIPQKSNSAKFDILEEILSLQNSKISDFEKFKECEKHVFYLIDGSKNINEFSIINIMNLANSEEEITNYMPFSFEIKKETPAILMNKDEEISKFQQEIQVLENERDSLKAEVLLLRSDNEKMQKQIKKITENGDVFEKMQENEKGKSVFSQSKIKKNYKTNDSSNKKNKEKDDKNKEKDEKNKEKNEKKYQTPRSSDKKKISSPQTEEKDQINDRFSDKNERKFQVSEPDFASDEEILIEEDPRPFPGKFTMKKFNSLIN